MTQSVKLHILPKNHSGPIVVHPATLSADEKHMVPSLFLKIDLYGDARMAYHDGTLYTDTEPLEWNAVDADRASALGYGPSDPWPFPDRIEAKQLGYNMTPGSQFTGLEFQENRQNKLALLNAHIYPKHGAYLLASYVRVLMKGTDRSIGIPYADFDTLTVGQLFTYIRERLQ